MTNHMLKIEGNHLEKVMALSIKGCEGYYDSRHNLALCACEQFILMAGILPEGAFLGWQLNGDKEGKRRAFAFSGTGAQLTQEDFDWTFKAFASVEAAPQSAVQEPWAKGRRIYALEHTPYTAEAEKRRRYLEKIDHRDAGRCFCNYGGLIEALDESGAVMRIISNAQHSRSGMVLISLPDEMPLRMRAMLSGAFSDVDVIELTTSDVIPEEDVWLPQHCLTTGLNGLLDELMLMAYKEEKEAKEKEENEKEDTGNDDDDLFTYEETDEEEDAQIENMDLSVRAYNCLARAGIKTVGQLRAMTDVDFGRIHNMNRRVMEEIKLKLAAWNSKAAEAQEEPVPEQPPAPDYFAMLEELIGLESVKAQVKRIAAFARMKQEMAALGRDGVPVALNMEFIGNPGTAKTTVARILAGIFHQIGLLPSDKLIEVGRADLVGQWCGHTADRVKSAFEMAKGKVLFIDEAYALVDHHDGLFGDEAINTIVQEMENNRSDTIVIFAGYPDKMKKFFAKNPGLRSRVPFAISFSDYSPEEMMQIAELEAKKRGFSIRPEAREKVVSICTAAAKQPDAGNGRFCRNLVESAVLGYAARVYGQDSEAAEKDFALADADFAAPEILRRAEEPKKRARMGFGT